MRPARAVPAVAVAFALAAALAAPAGAADPVLIPVLPDLVQATPTAISITTVVRPGRRTLQRLAFTSAVENDGRGDLIVVGRRASRRVSRMTADQLVERVDAADRPAADLHVRDVGHLHYVRLRDHAHWHLIGLERYELRSAATGRLAARDRKSGFCIGNRYSFRSPIAPLSARAGDFDPNCGKSRPGLLGVTEGISPGWADDYKANLEGQFVDITSVPAGRYVLVNRSDVEHRLHQVRRDNDAASVLLALTRPRGAAARVRVLRTCPGRPACG